MDSIDKSKICNLCCHCRYTPDIRKSPIDCYVCEYPENITGINLVTGNNDYKLELCKDQRENYSGGAGICGKEGRWYKQAGAAQILRSTIPVKPSIKSSVKVGTNLLEELGM